MNNKNNDNIPTPEVTAKITWINDDLSSNKKATANITIAKCFTVHGLSIMNSSKGLFVAMPTKIKQEQGNNKYYDVAHPVTTQMRQLISDKVLGAYQQMTNSQGQNEKQHSGQSQGSGTSEDSSSDEAPVGQTEDSSEVESLDEKSVPIMGLSM